LNNSYLLDRIAVKQVFDDADEYDETLAGAKILQEWLKKNIMIIIK